MHCRLLSLKKHTERLAAKKRNGKTNGNGLCQKIKPPIVSLVTGGSFLVDLRAYERSIVEFANLTFLKKSKSVLLKVNSGQINDVESIAPLLVF